MGAAWAVFRPVVQMIVFTYLFRTVANMPTDGAPYPIVVFSAMICWDVFANIVIGCAGSITSHKAMVEKLYCPRLIFPLSTVFVAGFDFLVASGIFGVLLLIYGFVPSANIIWLPILILGVVVVGLSVGLWLSAVAVWFRDVKFVVNYLVQLLMLLTPVGYGAASVPEKFSFFVDYNPMATMVETFRWAVIGSKFPDVSQVMVTGGIAALMFICGLMFFNTLERMFADVI